MQLQPKQTFSKPHALFLFCFLLFSTVVFAQNGEVRGRVVDSTSSQGIPRVSVTLRGKNTGVVTDDNGYYRIKAANGDVLVFTNLGYGSQQATVRGEAVPTIVLTSEAKQLTDVVVIGYGTRQRRDVTGAVSSVSARDLEKSTSMTPELALQGRAAGVFVESGGGAPGARPLFRIRGVNTFGYAEPLFVVDGVPIYEGGSGVTDGAIGDIRSPINIFSMINPQDIESISVLKDASAAAIYGVRASNGVVLITTKRGRTGRPKVEVAASYGVQNIPKTIAVLNTQQYFGLVREAYANNPEANGSGGFKTFEEKFGPLYDQSNPKYVGNGPTYDWQKELQNKNAPIQDHSVRLSGGNEATTYYLSFGYAKTESPLKANYLQRYSIATNVESRISKFIRTGLTVRLVQQNAYENTQSDLGTMMSTIPFQPFYDPSDPTGFAAVASAKFKLNPSYDAAALRAANPLSDNPTDAERAFQDKLVSALISQARAEGQPDSLFDGDPQLLWGPQTRYNVFGFQKLNSNNYDLVRALGNAFVEIEPISGLRLKGTLGGDYFVNLRRQFSDFDVYRFSQTPGNPFSNTNGKAEGSYGERQGKTYNLNKELTLNYTHTFGDHNVDILLGASEQFARWSFSDISSGNLQYRNPQFRGIANERGFVSGSAGILQEDALIGYVGRISYKYQDKYYLDGTLRYDGSSRLAPGHKWDKFPSFAAAWRISSEKFFPKVSFINDLKLRGGWGRLGNFQSAGYYKYLSGVALTSDYPLGSGGGNALGSQLQGAVLPNFANTTLTWEKLRTTNIGLDAQLFQNRIALTAEYYNKTTFDIIQSVSLPPNTGVEAPADLNVAQVRNKGFEFQLGYTNNLGPVSFNVTGNVTTVNNKVLKLNGGTPLGSEGGRIEEGYSMNYLWGYKVGGIFQTQAEIDAWRKSYADLSIGQSLNNPANGYQYKPGDMYFQDVYGNPKDGKERYSQTPDSLINTNDRTFLGKTIPGYYYGLNIGANYAGIDISVFFQGVGDVQKYNYLRASGESMSSLGNQWATVLDRWTPGHASGTIPRAVYNNPSNPGRTSDRYVENAGYLRLKNLQIGYALPKPLLGKVSFIQSLRIYGSAINLFTITDWSGLDPENDLIPPTRQFLVGINASF